MNGRESGMPDYSSWKTILNPRRILVRMDYVGSGGDVVGFGYGTFTIPAAELVTGGVLALDIEPGMVAATERKATEAVLPNVAAEVRDFIVTGCGRADESVGYARRLNDTGLELLLVDHPLTAVPGRETSPAWNGSGSCP